MKKILFSLFLIVTCFVIQVQGQFDSGYPILVRGNSGLEVQIEAILDSTLSSTTAPESLATGWIDISDFDASTEYVQLWSLFDADGTADTSSVLIDIWGNETASWTGAVSIIQLLDTTTSNSAAYTASTLSNKRPKYVNIVFENKPTSGDNADDSVDVHAVIRFPLKDAKVTDE